MHALCVLTILAQVPAGPDAISGSTGWVGAGLLGLVLGWLLFVHLPAKDKQIVGLVDGRDAMVKDLTASFKQAMADADKRAADVDRERREDYRVSLAMVVGHCEKELAITSGSIRQSLDDVGRAVAELRGLLKEIRDRQHGGQA